MLVVIWPKLLVIYPLLQPTYQAIQITSRANLFLEQRIFFCNNAQRLTCIGFLYKAMIPLDGKDIAITLSGNSYNNAVQ